MKCSSSSSSTSPSFGFLGFKKAAAHVFVAAMSFICSCFRVKDASSPSDLKNSTLEEPVVDRNRSPLSSLFISEENASNSKEEKGSEEQDLYFEELKKQAKFLKACGTIPGTPAEIKRVEAEKDSFSSQRGTVESLKFKSWLTYTSIEKLDLESQPDQLPKLNKDIEEWVKADGSQEHTPSSCMTIGRNSGRLSPNSKEGSVALDAVSSELLSTVDHSSAHSSVSTSITSPNIPCKNKSVRFDCELDIHSASSKVYSSETPIPTLTESRAADHYSNVKPSPYPTPLKLSDEMQTPGTVFPAYMDDIGQGKYPRIRTEYATHYGANPGERLSPLKTMDGDSCSDQPNNHYQEPSEKSHEAGEAKTGEISNFKDLIPDVSKSPLLATKSPEQDVSSASKIHRVKNPGDRPIIGLVAAHWTDNEPSRVSSKWWDGNGIPNSTNKYQEDQKVSWHATPFEERLEKALSEESLISQRKHSSGSSPPINFGKTEESDTAMSQLQSSTHFKPVISF